MKVCENELYIEDVKYVANLGLPWEKLRDKSIIISGATGLIGSFLIDVIMEKNRNGMNCSVYAMSRNYERAEERFDCFVNDKLFNYIQCDITIPFERSDLREVDYVIHLASNTHPVLYSTDPIGTITTNIVGTYNMLQFAEIHHAIRCMVVSSNEVYGENRGDVEFFDELYCGYIDSNTLRAGYPESKRCSEALCQAYIKQKSMDIVIPRLTRSFGPTMLMSDTKAISQFIKRAVSGQDIILKSPGTQFYSYTYVADAVSGLLFTLLKGGCGEAYNIADEQSDIMMKDLAAIIADFSGRKVVYEIPDLIEVEGYSKATKARLDSTKLKKLGWNPKYNIKSAIKRTLQILIDTKF